MIENRKIKIAYIKRAPLKKKGLLKNFLINIRNALIFYDQEAFFEASIYPHVSIKEFSLSGFWKKVDTINKDFDVLLINYKFFPRQFRSDDENKDLKHKELLKITDRVNIPKILLVANDRSDAMPPESVIDNIDLIFKREKYLDVSRYGFADKNISKIKKTMIPCQFKYQRKNIFGLPLQYYFNRHLRYFNSLNSDYEYDVSFVGKMSLTNNVRIDAWSKIVDSKGIKYFGGLQKNDNGELPPPNLRTNFLTKKEYVELIKKTRVNLALDGIGELTFRHMELFSLGVFVLSSPTIRGLDLPIEIKEGEHYICFDDYDDMLEKIKYYSANNEEREKIANNVKKFFEKEYSHEEHGKYILNCIKDILG